MFIWNEVGICSYGMRWKFVHMELMCVCSRIIICGFVLLLTESSEEDFDDDLIEADSGSEEDWNEEVMEDKAEDEEEEDMEEENGKSDQEDDSMSESD